MNVGSRNLLGCLKLVSYLGFGVAFAQGTSNSSNPSDRDIKAS